MTPVVETTTPVERERLFDCEHFLLWRLRGESPFAVGAKEEPRVLVCIEGSGQVTHEENFIRGRQGRSMALACGGRRM